MKLRLKICLSALAFTLACIVLAQQKQGARVVVQKKSCGEPFFVVEQMPTFVGGDTALFAFIKDSLRFPEESVRMGVRGRVVVRFVVDTAGVLRDISLYRGIDSLCDREALRLVASMPKWNPGRQNGKPVQAYFTLPINFKLQLQSDN